MSSDYIVRILREGMVLALLLSGGPLAVAAVTGLVISLLQATTQVQESTLSFVPKLIAVSATLVILGPWMLDQSVRFIRLMFEAIPLIR
jgi:flagellar biosynthesis protein FliQ